MTVSHTRHLTSVSGPTLAEVLKTRILLLDGGLSTALDAHGFVPDDWLWTAKAILRAPELLMRVHAEFAAAGADIVCTATYQASRAGLAKYHLDKAQADAVFATSVGLARKGAPHALVAASLGSYGAILHDGSEYRGDFTPPPGGLAPFHTQRILAAMNGAPDIIALETVPSLAEVIAMNQALDAAHVPSGCAWLSCSLQSDVRLGSGEPIEALADVPWSDAIAAIGFNCAPAGRIAAACERLAPLIKLPLVAYPNRSADGADTESYARGDVCSPQIVRRLIDCGARLLGGCCTVSANDIAALGAAIGAVCRSDAGPVRERD